MPGYDVTAALYESKLRIQMATRRATLMSTLGPAPEPEKLPMFRRRTRPLQADFVVRHAIAESLPASPAESEADLKKAA